MHQWYHNFRYRLTLLIGLLVIALGIGFVSFIYHIASQKLTSASSEELNNIARSTANMLAATLNERQREIILLSKRQRFESADTNLQPVRDAITLMQDSYSHYAWIGFANAQGIVVASGKGRLEGVDVSQRPWFYEGLKQAYLSDIHEAVLLANKLSESDNSEPLRFVDFAAPVFKSNGKLLGVVATHANWSWITEVLASTMPQNAKQRGVDVFITDRQGQLLFPFSSIGKVNIPQTLHLNGKSRPVIWQDGIEYMSSQIPVKTIKDTELVWQVVVRQPTDKALLSARDLLQNVLWLSLFAALFSMLLVYQLASKFSLPIESLANTAKQIQQGNVLVSFNMNNKLTEISSLARSLQTMTTTLLMRENALADINKTLEQKVIERTAALETANIELKELARRDPLIGIANRLAMAEALRHEFLLYKRSEVRFAVIILDIDYFKRVNDEYGHATGDIVLKKMASLITESIRETDMVARFGGEEFLILLPNTDETAIGVANKICKAVANYAFPTKDAITVSIGVAIIAKVDQNQDALIHRADQALYKVKNSGRNNVLMAGEL
jgi:diguanylate cyclase (GGDEF)-like protein